VYEWTDSIITVSENNTAILDHLNKGKCTVTTIPNGIDEEYYAGSQADSPHNNTLIFCGILDYPPNYNGISWFVTTIYPMLKKDVPNIRLLIVGKNPVQKIKELAKDPSITVTGTVPDIRPFYEMSNIAIVPLREGEGTRLKVVEGMAMKKPVIATTVGAEGVLPTSGVILADTPEEFARETIALLHDDKKAVQLGESNFAFVMEHYRWSILLEKLNSIISAT